MYILVFFFKLIFSIIYKSVQIIENKHHNLNSVNYRQLNHISIIRHIKFIIDYLLLVVKWNLKT